MNSEYMTDFSLKCGSWTSSFLYFCKALVAYIILPLALIALINGVGPRLSDAVSSGIDFGPILMEFAVYLDRYMLYSIPLLIFAIFIGYYPPGNYARIPFKFIASVYLAIMLMLFTEGGHLSISLGEGAFGAGTPIGGLDLTLDIVGIIYLLAIIAFVKGFLAFTEFSDNRKEYLSALAEKFNAKEQKHVDKDRKKSELDFDEDDEPVEAAPVEAEEEPAEAAPAEAEPAQEPEAKEEPAEAAPAEAEPEPEPEKKEE